MKPTEKLKIIAFSVAFAATAHAQTYSQAPMVVVGQEAAAAIADTPASGFSPNFPADAITRVGEATTGQQVDMPAAPPAPANPTPPTAPGTNVATPGAPANPTAPADPTRKLWPKDTVPIFVRACAGFHVEYVPACTCTITNLMLEMPHDEFLAQSEAGTIEQDERLIAIRSRCIATPARKE